MALQSGQQAPDFELVADDKSTFKLSDHRGKNVLLLFFPGAFTSVCTDELNAVNNTLSSYSDKDVEVVGISTDSPFVLSEFKKVNALDFPLLSDHNTEVSTRYGTKYEPGIFPFGLHRVSRRAAFLVDKSGTLRYTEVLENAGDQPDFDAIDAVKANL